jgi:hypothetical protein
MQLQPSENSLPIKDPEISQAHHVKLKELKRKEKNAKRMLESGAQVDIKPTIFLFGDFHFVQYMVMRSLLIIA